jgi:molecular chaperone DnaK
MSLSRAKLEQLSEDLIRRSIEPCKKALKDAGFSTSEITEIVLVGGMTRMPAIQEAVKSFFNKEPHKGVNPDEVVGIGAAIQAGVLGGDVKDVLLLDVTPLTLSIETLGGVSTPLIDRNSTIPTKKSQIFSTAADMQTQVEINVVQGERPMAIDNKSLGKFILDGIPPAPRGVPQIEVTFDINADGILNVNAKDKATGREQAMQILPSSGLADDEIERMVDEAKEHATVDADRKAAVEASNLADSAVYSGEKFIQDNVDKLTDVQKSSIQAEIDAVKATTDGTAEAIQAAVNRLQQALQEVGTSMYQQQAPDGDGTGATSSEGNGEGAADEDVIEGEFSED